MTERGANRLAGGCSGTGARLKEYGALVEEFLRTSLDDVPVPRLRDAMQYSLLAGGKRLRPVLCLACAALCGERPEAVLPFAAGIEMIHTYSLIHDDLPAMDNDDLRRGRPSNHKAFDEATAILAGDALLTDAFSFMASAAERIRPQLVLAALAELAGAAGSSGMVGGQMLDMEYTASFGSGQGHPARSIEALRRMNALKTGALFRSACAGGAVLAGAGPEQIAALRSYGAALGAAFQVVDDILDETQDTATLGKPAGSDAAQGKSTFPSLIGTGRSQELAVSLADEAVSHLDGFTGPDALFLKELAGMLVRRVN